MEWLLDGIDGINFWLVALASILTMVTGFFWYSNSLFGERWRKEVGMKKKDMESTDGMGPMFARSFILAFISSTVLFGILRASATTDWTQAFWLAVTLGVAFNFATVAVNNIYQKRSMTLSYIDGGYQIVSLVVVATVFILWG